MHAGSFSAVLAAFSRESLANITSFQRRIFGGQKFGGEIWYRRRAALHSWNSTAPVSS